MAAGRPCAAAAWTAWPPCLPWALRFGGYEIIEQSAFGAAFAGGYLADGAESVRIDPDAGQDLRFVNPYGQYTVLRLWREGSVLQCALMLTEALDAAPREDGAADEVILLPDVNEFLSLRSEPSTSASVIENGASGHAHARAGRIGHFLPCASGGERQRGLCAFRVCHCGGRGGRALAVQL